MKFSKRFKAKFKVNYKKITDKDLRVVWEAWDQIVNSDDFNQEDLLETLDYLVGIYKGKKLVFDEPSVVIFGSDNFDDLMFDLTAEQVEKYQDFFLKLNDHYSLNDMMESIIVHYGALLDWDTILTSTLFEEVDGQEINNRAMTLIENYYDIMFSKDIENDNYIPANGMLFLRCLELGIIIPYEYMRKSIFKKNTSFTYHLFIVFLNMFSDEIDIDESPFINIAFKDALEDEVSINVFNLHTRVSYDVEMMNYIEEHAISKSKEDEDDFGDDIGF